MNSLFPQINIKNLSDSDFNLNSNEKITLVEKRISLVLFNDNSDESVHFLNILKSVCKQVPGPVFCSCDILSQSGIKTAFLDICQDDTSSYQKFTCHGFPILIIYKNGIPQKLYSGIIDEDSLLLFCSTLIPFKNVEIHGKNSYEISH